MRAPKDARVRVFFPPVLEALLAEGVVAALAYPMWKPQNQKAHWADNGLEGVWCLLVFDDDLVLSNSGSLLLLDHRLHHVLLQLAFIVRKHRLL